MEEKVLRLLLKLKASSSTQSRISNLTSLVTAAPPVPFKPNYKQAFQEQIGVSSATIPTTSTPTSHPSKDNGSTFSPNDATILYSAHDYSNSTNI